MTTPPFVKRYTFIMTHGFEPDGRVYEVQSKEPHKHVCPPNRLVDAADYDDALRSLAAVREERDKLLSEIVDARLAPMGLAAERDDLRRERDAVRDDRDRMRGDIKTTEDVLRDFDGDTIWQQAQNAVSERDALARQVEQMQNIKSSLYRALDDKQAKIDALMFEFCPGEMSAEQKAEWAKHIGKFPKGVK